jgi:hypothetical protein
MPTHATSHALPPPPQADKPASLQALQRALSDAVSREDYSEAARLRDKLRYFRDDACQSLEAASARFYRAFERMDSGEMAHAWGVGDHVSCIHPGAACITGRDQARAHTQRSVNVASALVCDGCCAVCSPRRATPPLCACAGAGQLGPGVPRGRAAEDPAGGRERARHRVAGCARALWSKAQQKVQNTWRARARVLWRQRVCTQLRVRISAAQASHVGALTVCAVSRGVTLAHACRLHLLH